MKNTASCWLVAFVLPRKTNRLVVLRTSLWAMMFFLSAVGSASRSARTQGSPHVAPTLLGPARRGCGYPDTLHSLLHRGAGSEAGWRDYTHHTDAREGRQPDRASDGDPRPRRKRNRVDGLAGLGADRHAPPGRSERDRDGGVRAEGRSWPSVGAAGQDHVRVSLGIHQDPQGVARSGRHSRAGGLPAVHRPGPEPLRLRLS